MKVVKKAQQKSLAGRVPLYRALSKLGIVSREEAKALILDGKVKVHGSVEINPNRPINPDRAHIEISGKKAVKDVERMIKFHKPKGYLTTKRDPEGRPTIYDLIPQEFSHFHAVGRLDLHTSGLLLLTNSTKLSHYLTDPENKVPRTYIVKVKGLVSDEELREMKKGIIDSEESLQFLDAKILKSSTKECTLEVVLIEGKNREIRRMCAHFQHEVTSLKRISYGSLHLGELKLGGVEEVEIPKK